MFPCPFGFSWKKNCPKTWFLNFFLRLFSLSLWVSRSLLISLGVTFRTNILNIYDHFKGVWQWEMWPWKGHRQVHEQGATIQVFYSQFTVFSVFRRPSVKFWNTQKEDIKLLAWSSEWTYHIVNLSIIYCNFWNRGSLIGAILIQPRFGGIHLWNT